MFAFLSNFLQLKQIRLFSALPLDACRIKKPYLLERVGICCGSVLMIAVPYLTPAAHATDRNLSAYAVSRDYHLFFKNLFDELIPLLQERYPEHRFAGFADHSPIDEIHAAARAGLGVIGKNGLLITREHSSCVFLGALFTDADLGGEIFEIQSCQGCGKCLAACPKADGECLSSLTQKKGALTADEEERLTNHPLVWGCDICQEVCPHTARAIKDETIFTSIPYFYDAAIPYLNMQILEEMSDEEFACRAYSWRGRGVIERNLNFKKKGETEC